MGYDVHAPTLTGLGERAHLFRADVDLDCHIEDIVAFLHYEDLRDADPGRTQLRRHGDHRCSRPRARPCRPSRVSGREATQGRAVLGRCRGPLHGGGQIGQPDRRRRRDVPVSRPTRRSTFYGVDRSADLGVDARTAYRRIRGDASSSRCNSRMKLRCSRFRSHISARRHSCRCATPTNCGSSRMDDCGISTPATT